MTADDAKSRRRKLSADERALWRRVIRSVAPIKRIPVASERPDTDVPARKSVAAPSLRAEPVVARRTGLAPKPSPSLAPLDRRLKQRLARGAEPIDARIDLHSRTQGEAYAALLRFLHKARSDGAKFVLVITGKGTRADESWNERGILRRQVPLWLRLPEFRPYVIGFEEAHIGHGGKGALYVRVRRTRAD
jgi:DNA-nicking Smr family endonuclease